MSSSRLIALEYEVFGKVQGVFFRKYTDKQASKLGVRGWIMNTKNQTVKGELEGPADKIMEMKNWLQITGSPSSRIDKAVFNNEKEIEKYTFEHFGIRK